MASDTKDQSPFWHKVENYIMARKNLELGYAEWAPFIGKAASASIFNTEYQKVPQDDSATPAVEDEELEFSEDSLLKLLCDKQLPEIQQACRDASVSDKGLKLECLQRLKDSFVNRSAFNKVFMRLSGRTDGLLACCPHGITYGLKYLLRGETPRDHVDMILSLAHQPTVHLCDIPWLVAKHGKKRKEKMYSPNEGHFVDSSGENLERVKAGTLSVSLPLLCPGQLGKKTKAIALDH